MKIMRKHNGIISSQRAFTLAELLIVVAIIAVLVGISIPIFIAQKEKSAEATDIANMRAAKAAAVAAYYNGITDSKSAQANGFKWWPGTYPEACGVYDVSTGKFSTKRVLEFINASGSYGKGTPTNGGTQYYGYDSTLDYSKAVIQVSIYPEGAGTLIHQFGTYDASLESTPCIIIQWKKGQNLVDFIRPAGTDRFGQIYFLDD